MSVTWENTHYLRMQIARFTVGSRLYGMEHAESDHDLRVIFAYHPSALLGLDARRLPLTNQLSHAPGDRADGRPVEVTYQEVGHVVGEVCSGSLNAVEMLFSVPESEQRPHGEAALFLGERRGFPAPLQMLIDWRDHLLTRDLVDMTLRYARAQFARWERDVTDPKPLLHAMRTSYAAHLMMTQRTLRPRLPAEMVAQCRDDVARARPLDDTIAMHWFQQAKHERHFGKTTYAEMPHTVDRGRLNQILLSVRDEAWRPRA